MPLRVDLAGVVPAYQQLLWVHQLLHSQRRVSILERVTLLAMAAMGEIDVAQGNPVVPVSSTDIADWVGFAEDDIWNCCLAMSHRGWLLHHEGDNAFTLVVAYPSVAEDSAVEHPDSPSM